ncbi:hypothetical protein OIU77_027824 [Salix suchowensis]|uniref:Uncharacterized protein n=1 Tax=Salix suchowensis TaxID=1278906 RepID=A0ABQ9BR17_9ROSI|nr:hypothetical protein OIU77_027824 [Salix suchowensis]
MAASMLAMETKKPWDMNQVRLVEEVAVDFSAGTTAADLIGQRREGPLVGPRGRNGRFSLFGECAKQKKSESRNTR